jgi:EmrB/QacA subfamily drug resistance transporter
MLSPSQSVAPRPDRWRILPLVMLAPFMGSLDGSIVNVALPSIAKGLGSGMDGVQWAVSSYLIAISALVLAFGKVADILGKTRVFRLGFLVFGAGSLLCACAWSLGALVAARVFQAIGASMFMSSNQGIVASVFPHEERGRALGFLGTTVAIGTMIGPPLGGLMVQLLGWQSLFLINVPVSVFAFVAGSRLPRDDKGGSLAGFDLAGTLLFSLFIASLFFYLLTGQGRGWLSPIELSAVAIAALSLVLFLGRERRAKDPMIDLGIFRSPIFSVSIVCALLVFCASFCVNIVQPFYLQDILGLSPAMAGLVLLASSVANGVVAPLGGYLADKYGAERLTILGLCFELSALILMSFQGASASPLSVAAGLALFGLGQGIFASPNTKLVMMHAPQDRLGIAGSVNTLARNMGMVSGIAFAVSVLYGVMSARLGRPVSSFSADQGEAFIAGMRAAFLSAGLFVLAAIALTGARAAAARG